MSTHDINLLINVFVIILNLIASFFPVYWRRKYNHDYLDGLRLVAPALAISVIGGVLFLILYVERLTGNLTNDELQRYARLVLLVLLFTPSSLVLSLHNWKK